MFPKTKTKNEMKWKSLTLKKNFFWINEFITFFLTCFLFVTFKFKSMFKWYIKIILIFISFNNNNNNIIIIIMKNSSAFIFCFCLQIINNKKQQIIINIYIDRFTLTMTIKNYWKKTNKKQQDRLGTMMTSKFTDELRKWKTKKKRFIKLLFQFNQINLIDFHSLKLFFYGTVTFWSFRVWSTTTTTQTSSQPINTDILIFFLYKDNDCPKKGIMFELYNVFIVPEFNLWNFLFYSFLPFFDCSNFFLTYTPCAWTWFFSNHNNRWPWFSLLFFFIRCSVWW